MRSNKLFDYDGLLQLGERIMSRRCCSHKSDGKILLNPRLIEAPREAIHYVCVHELAHATNAKHDEAFHKELDRRLPNWRRTKESLGIRFG